MEMLIFIRISGVGPAAAACNTIDVDLMRRPGGHPEGGTELRQRVACGEIKKEYSVGVEGKRGS